MDMPWTKSEPMSESPPTPARRATTTRLFFGEDDNDDDMVETALPSASTPLPYHLPSHKRHGGDDNNVWVSPHISPSFFKTIDGRTVYSRNPFSPMASSCPSTINNHSTTHDSKTSAVTSLATAAGKHPVPSFPVALSAASSWDEGAGSSGASGSASTEPTTTIPRLVRRDSTGFELPQASSLTLWTSSKVRRLTVETDDVGKGQPSQRSRYSYQDHDHDDNNDHNNNDHHPPVLTGLVEMKDVVDRISPTDVTQFAPQLLPPSTPLKPPRPSSSSFSFYDAVVPTVTASTPPRTFIGMTTNTSSTTTQPPPPLTPQLTRRSMARLVLAPTPSRSRSGSIGSSGGCGSPDNSKTSHTVMEDDGRHQHTNNAIPSRFTQDFDLLEVLGQGSFGTVYNCLSRLDGCLYAIKTTLRPAKGHADRHRMFKEVYALAALSDHADPATFHIVRYHQAWMEQDCRLYIQTELCTCTLAQESKETLTVPRRYKLLREMCLALDLCHRNGMVHLDIKPDNIFVKNDQYKLGDFGLVSRYRTKQQVAEEEGGEDEQAEDKNEVVEEGDSRYMSRELLQGDWNDLTKCDIFSLGATIYQICVGRPLPANGPEWHDLRSGHLPLDAPTALPTPLEMSSMIQEMMHPDAWQRPPAAQLLERRQLLSEERKALIAEQNKVREAAMALAETRRKLSHPKQQQQQQSNWPPPLRNAATKGGLIRANTWNGGF